MDKQSCQEDIENWEDEEKIKEVICKQRMELFPPEREEAGKAHNRTIEITGFLTALQERQ